MYELNPNIIEQKDSIKAQFAINRPFEHIVIDNFLPEHLANNLLANFPDVESMPKRYKALNENKSEFSELGQVHECFVDLKQYLASERFIEWLNEITGIEEELLEDDYNFGGGCHQGAKGSYLDVHADFNIHPKSKLHRRINLLIYFNKNWSEEDGGLLELWNENVSICEQKILPEFNRCVIFKTSEISFHGYDTVTCNEPNTRKSFAAYYYSKTRPEPELFDEHTTIFKTRPNENVIKKSATKLRNKLADVATKIKQ